MNSTFFSKTTHKLGQRKLRSRCCALVKLERYAECTVYVKSQKWRPVIGIWSYIAQWGTTRQNLDDTRKGNLGDRGRLGVTIMAGDYSLGGVSELSITGDNRRTDMCRWLQRQALPQSFSIGDVLTLAEIQNRRDRRASSER
jgi:hypothetical protein